MKRNRFASRGCANGLRGVALFLCVILGGMWASAATTAQLRAAFPGATVSGSTVTLTADIGPCVLTNTWGTVTVDLNGHGQKGNAQLLSLLGGDAAVAVCHNGDLHSKFLLLCRR